MNTEPQTPTQISTGIFLLQTFKLSHFWQARQIPLSILLFSNLMFELLFNVLLSNIWVNLEPENTEPRQQGEFLLGLGPV